MAIRLGLIGCGNLGKRHAGCVEKIDGAEFAAYADIDEEAAEGALSAFGGDYATTDVDRVFADDSIDAVYICTRHKTSTNAWIAAAFMAEPSSA